MRPFRAFSATFVAFALAAGLSGCIGTAGPDGLTRREHEAVQQREAALLASPQRVDDPALQRHLDETVCRLDATACGVVRIVVLDAAGLQADLIGARLLRLHRVLLETLGDDEAALAFVLGHELAHRRLAHVAARRRSDWDAAAAELAADAEAVRLVVAAGYRDAGVETLRRLRVAGGIDDVVLDARIAALEGAAAGR